MKDDCISRQAVIDGIDRYIEKAQSNGTKDDLISFEELVIKSLPSVTPQEPKTDILDKIRAETEQAFCKVENDYDHGRNYGLYMAMQIIDKYRQEG